ncbi:LOW QUALITY PROTEIN: protein cordon-bleu-like [Mya arenaria]|uniref:LOW QUALITY PROTEIN: protein cordon-bleu-like n=1 Tax=Mya arenaria TaxID=6604 RepID=UPI0022E89806|nr:LOW QUALITY PROTEIN: protein cordon-bleu-like [Mya arenaria]
MSGSYSMKGTQPVGPGRKKGSLATNGSGPPPLSYPADPPDDENMNEIISENVELTVYLPNGTQNQMTIEPNIPMMDLLINLAQSSKLNPASHSLKVLTGDKWRQIDFKANKTIGVLAGDDGKVSVQVVKKQREDKVKQKVANQPFEMTYRFTVNLPGNQKEVIRISPKQSLGEVRSIICAKKNFDPTQYLFILPTDPSSSVDDSTSVGDLKSNEINFESVAVLRAAEARSMPDLAYAAAKSGSESKEPRPSDNAPFMPSAGEKKAKRGFFSMLSKKEKKFKLQTSSEIEDVRSRPKKAESFNVGQQQPRQRPHTMHADSGELDHFNLRNTTGDLHKYSDFRKSTGLLPVNENLALSAKSDSGLEAPSKKGGKKRAAPLPPHIAAKPRTVQVEINVQPQSNEPRIEDVSEVRLPLKKNHSRNSSDSSGYHELTVSGADSPDANKTDNLQTTLDTTSIDSAEHFNGDSGIRDMSPMRARNLGQIPGSRDSSAEPERPPVLNRKKKRAPLPPPGMTAVPEPAQPTTTQATTNIGERPPPCGATAMDEELSALQAMEEVTMKFNIDDSDEDEEHFDTDREPGLAMMETSSLHSEDGELDLNHRQRPPTFVAPPPPSEPPPEDSEPVNINMITHTVDIGVGDSTTSSAPSSSKSSPKSISSRRDSMSSNSSINTIEDLSQAFKLTIAMGEEALGIDTDDNVSEHGDNSVQDELNAAMPEFKAHISSLAAEGGEEGPTSQRSQTSSSDASSREREAANHDSLAIDRTNEGNRESAEITYEFTVDTVPADFQNGQKSDSSDEESFVTEEVIEYFPAQPDLDVGSPRKIPDLESPKEHAHSVSVHPHEVFGDIKLENGGEKVSETVDQPAEPEVHEKEEFVISLDELSNMDFSATDPNQSAKPKRESDVPKVNYRIEFRSSLDMDSYEALPAYAMQETIEPASVSVVNQEPVFYDDEEEEEYTKDISVKDKCSELSFTPNSEGEAEHLMEEKSISMIALPAERTPVKSPPQETTYSSSSQVGLSQGAGNPEPSPRSEEGDAGLQAQYSVMQDQMAQWQNQLLANQQLLANSASPELTTSGPADQSSLQFQQLQLQIQMQQQMLLQLQQSMASLALQNSLAAQQVHPQQAQIPNQALSTPPQSVGSASPQQTGFQTSTPLPEMPTMRVHSPRQETSPVLNAQPAAPPPPPAPAPITKIKPSKADAKYSKPKQKKFDRQLDPREQLMLDIRNFGKKGLIKVPVKATHWHK